MTSMTRDVLDKRITDDEVRNVAKLMGLPPDAFHGKDGKDSRQQVLRSMKTLDVAACPGSGKTTLLVAKLALLAQKWSWSTSGICVLSHTNVAREEIERRLGHTSLGAELLGHPHFIGTIHRFVNQFLALPWLRRSGFPVRMVDDTHCRERRWRKIPRNFQTGLQHRRIYPTDLVLADSTFNVMKPNGKLPFGHDTPTYKALVRAFRETAEEGFYCHHDMFVFAEKFLDVYPPIIQLVRSRFPLLFIDEAQDLTFEQTNLLDRLFSDGEKPVVRQRFGDGNQAIYHTSTYGEREGNFPEVDISIPVRNSFRFGRTIAEAVDPLGLQPYGMEGEGPKKALARFGGATCAPKTMILFDEATIQNVVNAFGEIVIETFGEEDLANRTFAVIGQVHRPKEKKSEEKFAHHVGHYWKPYNPVLARHHPKLETLAEYVHLAAAHASEPGDLHRAVNILAAGLWRFILMASTASSMARSSRPHQRLLRVLGQHPDKQKVYLDFMKAVLLQGRQPSGSEWANWVERLTSVVTVATGGVVDTNKTLGFLCWREPSSTHQAHLEQAGASNEYEFSKDKKQIHLKFDSIHSVKGREFTGVLVLETHWHDYGLQSILPWIVGTKRGGTGRPRRDYHLKVHYVAMTRPTHLLCVALMKGSLENVKSPVAISDLKENGWRVVDLTELQSASVSGTG